MRVRGTLEYLGTSWSGWQLQTNAPTLQGELERAIGVVTGAPVRVIAAGRTDAGVHATGQVIAFEVADGTDLGKLCRAVNGVTHPSVSVLHLERINDAFDPRRHALSRTYEYTIVNERPPSPFLADRSWQLYAPLDLDLLQSLAGMLLGEHDFVAFRAPDCVSKSTLRTVTESQWTRDGFILTYRVSANAFLKQMVRTMVGSMADVGLGKLDAGAFAELLAGGSRTLAGRTAPAQGLALVRVEYPKGFE